jgi:hypothetical protein
MRAAAEFRAAHFLINLRVGRIEAYRNNVEKTFEIARGISAVDKVAVTVRIYAYRYIASLAYFAAYLANVSKSFRRLAVAAENDFGIF